MKIDITYLEDEECFEICISDGFIPGDHAFRIGTGDLRTLRASVTAALEMMDFEICGAIHVEAKP